jgi:hypothetical protein
MSTTVKVQIQQRIDTASAWTTANPTLLAGEVGWESDTKKYKIGDGNTLWAALAYAPGSGGYTAGTGVAISASNVITASAVALTTVQTAANETAMLALTTQEGDVVVRSDENKSYVRNSGTAGSMADFTLLATPTDAVLSVNGNTGAITADQLAAAIEAASDSNTFTDADHTKLNGIETAASADQTAAEIVALVADQTIAPSEIDMEDSEKIKLGTGDDLEIYASGSLSMIDNTEGNLHIRNQATSGQIKIQPKSGEDGINVIQDGAVEAFFNNSKKAETASWGLNILGNCGVGDSSKFQCGDSQDLTLYHNGSDNFIDTYWNLTIRKDNGAETLAKFTNNGAVDLFYDGGTDPKLTTTSSGVTVTGRVRDTKGYDLRSIPKNSISANYTLVWADAGKHLYCTNSPTITIPSGTFSEGDAITIINASTSDMTIARAANVNLYMPDGTDANCTVGKYGMVTILHVNGVTDVFWISGSPLSQ